jgi:predicted helicase
LKPKEKITNPIAVLRKSKNWDDFNSHLDALSGKEKLKGDCFEELTEHYLKLHPRYATIVKKVWNLRKESSKNIKRKLKLPSSDEGIDLEAKRILVAVPSLALIRQTLDVWALLIF